MSESAIWRWDCIACGNGNNSYIYDTTCPHCLEPRDTHSIVWKIDDYWVPGGAQTSTRVRSYNSGEIDDDYKALFQHLRQNTSFHPSRSKRLSNIDYLSDSEVSSNSSRSSPKPTDLDPIWTSDRKEHLSRGRHHDHRAGTTENYYGGAQRPAGGITSLQYNLVTTQPKNKSTEPEDRKASSNHLDPSPEELAGADYVPKNSPSLVAEDDDLQNARLGDWASPMSCSSISEGGVAENIDDSTDSVYSNSHSPTTPTTSPPVELINNEWLLPLQNHPSFPEILQAWNDFVQQFITYGNQEVSQAPSSSIDSSLQSESSTSPNQGKRKRVRDDDGNGELPSSKVQVQEKPVPGVEDEKHFACHFLKLDVKLYWHCNLSRFKDVRTATQHLRKTHKVPTRTLPKWVGQGESEHTKWYLIWDKIFPGESPPKSPYTIGPEEVLASFINHLRSFPEVPDFVDDVEQHSFNWLSPRNLATTAIQIVTPSSVVSEGHSSSTFVNFDTISRQNVTAVTLEGATIPFTDIEAQVTLGMDSTLTDVLSPLYTNEESTAGGRSSFHHSPRETTLITNYQTIRNPPGHLINTHTNEVNSILSMNSFGMQETTTHTERLQIPTAEANSSNSYLETTIINADSLHGPNVASNGNINQIQDQSLTVNEPPGQTVPQYSMEFSDTAPSDWGTISPSTPQSEYIQRPNDNELDFMWNSYMLEEPQTSQGTSIFRSDRLGTISFEPVREYPPTTNLRQLSMLETPISQSRAGRNLIPQRQRQPNESSVGEETPIEPSGHEGLGPRFHRANSPHLDIHRAPVMDICYEPTDLD